MNVQCPLGLGDVCPVSTGSGRCLSSVHWIWAMSVQCPLGLGDVCPVSTGSADIGPVSTGSGRCLSSVHWVEPLRRQGDHTLCHQPVVTLLIQ